MKQNKEKKGLTKINLAIIGGLDDFYDAYERTREVFLLEVEKDAEENENKYPSPPWQIEKKICRQIRKIHEALFQNYSFLFVDAPRTVHATAEAFNHFTLLERDPVHAPRLRLISFSSYLSMIQFIISFTLFCRKKRENEKRIVLLESVQEETNEHILSIIAKFETEHRITSHECVPNNEPLFVFDRLSATRCFRNEHKLVQKVYWAKRIDSSECQALPTHYCEQCEKYMIGRITLNLYNKEFGKVLVRLKNEKEDSAFDTLNLESPLHQLGYNVIDGLLSEVERHQLLISILENQKLSYAEICSTIEQNIARFEGIERYNLALLKWKRDLKFLGDYVIKKNDCRTIE